MQESNELKDWKKHIQKKRLVLIMVCVLAMGIFLGSMIEGTRQKKIAAAQNEKAVASAKAEAEKEIKKLQSQLSQEQEEKEALPWNLTLVNSTHPMEEGYVPELEQITPEYSVDSRIAEPLREMLEAAKQDGMRIEICSAYRSVEKQAQVFNTSVQERVNKGMNYWQAYKDTMGSVAIPGTSEHGMGLALDLISNQYTGLDENQAHTKEAQWLEKNCYKYGFILRYPPAKTAETGIIYEPWHYRYVGKKDAEKIMKSGVTLETYLKEKY